MTHAKRPGRGWGRTMFLGASQSRWNMSGMIGSMSGLRLFLSRPKFANYLQFPMNPTDRPRVITIGENLGLTDDRKKDERGARVRARPQSSVTLQPRKKYRTVWPSGLRR